MSGNYLQLNAAVTTGVDFCHVFQSMFCFQCQEAAKGSGCVLKGVCGKESTTARYMDLLLFVVRGVAVAADVLRNNRLVVEEEVNLFVTDALFATITNANFDNESIREAGAERTGLARQVEGAGTGERSGLAGKGRTGLERDSGGV